MSAIDKQGDHWTFNPWDANEWTVMGLGFDGVTGEQVWQTRYDDAELPSLTVQGSTLSADGEPFYVTATPHAGYGAGLGPGGEHVPTTVMAYPTAGA